jgi:alpha-beta hydrolase superfamily lysophospholipase
VKRVAAHALSAVWGGLQMATGLDARDLSHDPAVAAAVLNDMLTHRKGTPRLYTELKETMEKMRSHHKGFRHPLLFVIPLADKIVSPEAALTFAKKLDLGDNPNQKRIVEFPGFFHEPLNEVGKEKVFSEIKQWIKIHSEN